MKKRFVIVALLVAAVCASAGTVIASSFEWVTDFAYLGSGPHTFRWITNTSGNYYEYRSMYWSFSSSGPWTELTECRKDGYVNGSITDKCAVTSYIPTSTPLSVRATTNYSGCGTWTSTPDTANCGDVQQFSITLP